jgi:hypothetical protein
LDPLTNTFLGHFTGTLTTSTGTGDFPVVLGTAWQLTGVSLAMKTTADQAVIASVYNQGVAVYQSTARPQIGSGAVVSGLWSTGFASTSLQDFTSTEAFSMKLDQVGTSTAPGTFLTATVHWRLM